MWMDVIVYKGQLSGAFMKLIAMEIVYDKSVVVMPKHFTLDFFEEILENALQDTESKIERIVIEMGSGTGDNYCSFIYRVQITFTRNGENQCSSVLSVIVKSTPVSTATDFLDDMKVFLKEKVFYYYVLPVMEHCVGHKCRFGARIYHSLKKPVNTLVFEDLKVLGYKLGSRELGLDEHHVKLVLTRLAHFHSVSVMAMEKDPQLLTCFNSGILSRGAIQKSNSNFYAFVRSSCEALLDLAKTWNGYEEIVRKLEKYVANLREHLLKMQRRLPGEFEVLNHGDLWVNNVMFKYDTKSQPSDLVFVDYQMTVWGSPGIDLNYFLYTSLPVDLLKSKREYFVRTYYNELKKNLTELKYKHIPSFEELRSQIDLREPFGFFANHAIYPIISVDKNIAEDSTFENFANAEFARNKFKEIFSQDKLSDMYRYTLLHFNEMKVFD